MAEAALLRATGLGAPLRRPGRGRRGLDRPARRRDACRDRHQRRRQVDADQHALRRDRRRRAGTRRASPAHDVTALVAAAARARRPRPQLPAHDDLPEFSVLENCRLAAQAATPRPWTLLASGGGRCATSLRRGASRRSTRPACADVAARTAGTLSHGGKRQLEIAMCLATRAARAAARRAARRHGRRGDRAHAGAARPRSSRRTRSCWSSTTWTRCSASPTGSR